MINKNKIFNKFITDFDKRYAVYKKSFVFNDEGYFFIAKDNYRKYLFIISSSGLLRKFDGKVIGNVETNNNNLTVKKSCLSSKNLGIIRQMFPHLSPVVCGLRTSFGTGDRLGISTPAHIQAFRNKKIFPFLCQQSVREINKEKRSWQKVFDDVIWGIFESGYKGNFGADADHVKKIEDLSNVIDIGFTMFTIDPSDYILRETGKLTGIKINEIYNLVPERKEIEKLYVGKEFIINKKKLVFDKSSLILIAATYSKVIEHIVKCHKFIKQNRKEDFDFEVSLDEVDREMSPLSHLFIALELERNEVNFQNLALRFTGEWQKAVDYIGDLKKLIENIKMHAEIAQKYGGYKLSLHSGSDKFSVYNIFSKETKGFYHIKTSGTSWLESMRTIAIKNPNLFYKIYNYSLKRFEYDMESYLHSVSTKILTVPDVNKLSENKLGRLLNLPECRQMLHITFGSILNAIENDKYIFRDEIYKTLFENETLHYRYVSGNIKKHLNLLNI
jgi:hypothetical protein